ncbi:hypothetical protein F4780DRAFT_740279, partial [Xylariomycetidae sp. FL0641]
MEPRLVQRKHAVDLDCSYVWIIAPEHGTCSTTRDSISFPHGTWGTDKKLVGSDLPHITARLGTRDGWVNLTMHLYVGRKEEGGPLEKIERVNGAPNPQLFVWGRYPAAKCLPESQAKPWDERADAMPYTVRVTEKGATQRSRKEMYKAMQAD